ncbi:MAG: VOC family protein [Ktedonobacteraceae bacterium]|nr:VOC family protein [Ktedonobacteraceae bacterium]MBV9711599.1 VOC family protein [Ktedonobacteraceae bacterium]
MPMQFQKPEYIIIYVNDMDRSLAFYRDILGLPLKFSSPGWSEFNTGTTTIALHATPASRPADQPGRTPSGVAQLGFMVDDLQAAYEALKAQDIVFTMPPQKQSSGVTLAVLRDPDGLGITLQQR